MRVECKLAAAAVVAFLVSATLPALAVTSSPQVRHLVYSFTWGTTNTTEVHTSGMGSVGNPTGAGGMSDHGSASGMSSASGGTSDRGTISVDVVRQQSDGGLVVNVSEQAIERRSAPAATCVVYGDLTSSAIPTRRSTKKNSRCSVCWARTSSIQARSMPSATGSGCRAGHRPRRRRTSRSPRMPTAS